MQAIVNADVRQWAPQVPQERSAELAAHIEAGRVLWLPQLAFALEPGETRFLDERWSNGADKNISLAAAQAPLKGAAGEAVDLDALRAMVARFRAQAVSLIQSLLPDYESHLRVAGTSFRPARVQGRATSWRKDDSRLHVDAFPSRPNYGERILRVFTNVNPAGVPRVWRVGEPFEDVAKRFLPHIKPQLPGAAWLLNLLHVTKSPRSAYDHLMLNLHDSMKADLDYQKTSPQETMPFPPGCVWICFSDQTSHAVMSGQFMLEQTFFLPVDAMVRRECAPLGILERLTGRALV